MAKRKKTITAGNIVKTIIYTAPEPCDSARARGVKSRMTTAAQKAINDKTARGRLEMLLSANFVGHDLFVTLTYRDADLPEKRATAVENVHKFLKHLRAHRRARGQLLKYIYTTENKHGDVRLHHHLVINATERDLEAIHSLWTFGDIIDLEYVSKYGYETLALYITKEGVEYRPVGAQMWTGSRNLEKPKVEISYVPNDTTLTVSPGCFVLEREEKMTEYGHYCYIKYEIPAWYKNGADRRRASDFKEKAGPCYLTCNNI